MSARITAEQPALPEKQIDEVTLRLFSAAYSESDGDHAAHVARYGNLTDDKWFAEKRTEIALLRSALRSIEKITGAAFSPVLANDTIGKVHDTARAALTLKGSDQ
jgi:hypothetical protein